MKYLELYLDKREGELLEQRLDIFKKIKKTLDSVELTLQEKSDVITCDAVVFLLSIDESLKEGISKYVKD